MARLRYNGLTAALGASLTNSATAVTFAAGLTHSNGTNVPTISGSDYIPLAILDSNGHLSEIVWLTAYTAAATTGTILRAQEGTAGVTHSSGDKIVHGGFIRDLAEAFPTGSFDAPPSPANAKDDEYDGTSSVTWTASPTAANARSRNSTRAGHLYVKAASGNASHLVGEYQAIPGSFPFTVTTKVVSTTARAAFHRGGGLVFWPASPSTSSACVYLGSVYNSSAPTGLEIVRVTYTSDSGFGSQSTFIGQRAGLPAREYYLKAVFSDATHADLYYSTDGFAWVLAESYVFGFTVANMGVAQSEETANTGVEAYYGFFRVS